MGKVKKKASKRKTTSSTMETDQAPGGLSQMDIDFNALKRQLTEDKGGGDDDAKTAITSRSFKGMNLKKKEKMKVKKEFWGKKMDMIKSIHKEEKERKKRRQTAVVGDMKPLSDALPSLELLMRQCREVKAQKQPGKAKAIKKEFSRHKEMLHDMKMFKMVVDHPAYRSNALSTINTHLRNKLDQDANT